MAPDQAPDDFDWVAAQATCNAASMYERLRARVKADAERRNRLSDFRSGERFKFDEDEGGFEVSRAVPSGSDVSAAYVEFIREGRRIHVKGDGVDVDFTMVVALDAAGICRFVVQDVTYAEWEIARMALEPLFFEEGDEGTLAGPGRGR